MNAQLVVKQAQRWLLHLSREGALALAMFAVAIGFGVIALPPAIHQLGRLEADVASLHDRIRNAAQKISDNPDDPVEQLGTFYRFFPATSTATRALDTLYKDAANLGLRLQQGDYRPVIEPGTRLVRYQITLPVHGDYLQIRKFVANVLADLPIASLDHIGFERHRVGESAVEARIKLTLHFNPEER